MNSKAKMKAAKRMLISKLFWSIMWLLLLSSQPTNCEFVRELEVSEGVPVGHQIGFIGDFPQAVGSGPPYLIVPVPGSSVDSDLAIDHTTGEVRTKVVLDRETKASYSLVAIPLSGDNIRVVVRVKDENDNPPTFPTSVMHIEFPENTPRDVKRTLNPARDFDLGRFNTQRYNIVSGNVNNAFRLSSVSINQLLIDCPKLKNIFFDSIGSATVCCISICRSTDFSIVKQLPPIAWLLKLWTAGRLHFEAK